jgi:hypothetical protein
VISGLKSPGQTYVARLLGRCGLLLDRGGGGCGSSSRSLSLVLLLFFLLDRFASADIDDGRPDLVGKLFIISRRPLLGLGHFLVIAVRVVLLDLEVSGVKLGWGFDRLGDRSGRENGSILGVLDGGRSRGGRRRR